MSRFVGLPELTEYLGGVPRSFVYARTKRGSNDAIPHARIGSKLFFDLDEIDKWVEAHRVEQPRQEWSSNLNHIRKAEAGPAGPAPDTITNAIPLASRKGHRHVTA